MFGLFYEKNSRERAVKYSKVVFELILVPGSLCLSSPLWASIYKGVLFQKYVILKHIRYTACFQSLQ